MHLPFPEASHLVAQLQEPASIAGGCRSLPQLLKQPGQAVVGVILFHLVWGKASLALTFGVRAECRRRG